MWHDVTFGRCSIALGDSVFIWMFLLTNGDICEELTWYTYLKIEKNTFMVIRRQNSKTLYHVANVFNVIREILCFNWLPLTSKQLILMANIWLKQVATLKL